MPPSWRRRISISAVAVVIAALFLSGCTTSSTPSNPPSGDSSSFSPVTIEHALGSTTITSPPERVVTVGFTDQEPVLALGVKPVGVREWWDLKTDTSWPWVRDAWGNFTPESVGSNSAGDTIEFEKIAKLKPDLILALYADLTEEQYTRLTQIAPTVAQNGDYPAYSTPWSVTTATVGKALGKEKEANELINSIEKRFETARSEHPEFASQTAAITDVSEDSFWPFSAKDPRGVFLDSLGYQAPERLNAWLGDKWGEKLSRENLDYLDVDRLIVLANKSNRSFFESDPYFQSLKVVNNGGLTVIPYDEDPPIGAAIAYNSVLSVPYALDNLLPLLSSP